MSDRAKRTASESLIQRLATARRVAVLTGAGISAESGIPTFRDAGGLWDQFKPEELANIGAFLGNPALVQAWYRHRRQVAQETEPNPGHIALRDLEELVDDFTLITQNVDNLHRRAGSSNIIELHGNITRSYCIDCARLSSEEEMIALSTNETAHCAACGGLIRPDVVWFGEMLPTAQIEGAFDAAQRAEVFLCIGTSAVVYPAAGIPQAAGRSGAYVAEVNVEPSAIAAELDEVIIGPSGVKLPEIVEAVRAWRRDGTAGG